MGISGTNVVVFVSSTAAFCFSKQPPIHCQFGSFGRTLELLNTEKCGKSRLLLLIQNINLERKKNI